MDMIDVVLRLNGPIEPVGDSSIDSNRLFNLRALCDLTQLLMDRIQALAETSGDHLASVKAAKDCAATFIAAARRVPEDARADVIAVADYIEFDGCMSEEDAARRIAVLRRIAGGVTPTSENSFRDPATWAAYHAMAERTHGVKEVPHG